MSVLPGGTKLENLVVLGEKCLFHLWTEQDGAVGMVRGLGCSVSSNLT